MTSAAARAGRPQAGVAWRVKRLLDLGVAALGLVLFAPVMALVALAVRCTMGRPVLFRQVRAGFRGRPITVFKFRSMREARAVDGSPLPDGQRLTRLGRFLRKTSLDELPQLWSVLRGDMALVGPRPLLTEYLPLYSDAQRRRHDVRPGITGWAQVNGRNALTWEEKLRLDVWYVDNWSLALDLAILARTVWAVLRGSGISQAGRPTAERFQGGGAAPPV
jgi:lipopolysaccharide/colanic/teichoic acid biosynthesis glycosyltransferase